MHIINQKSKRLQMFYLNRNTPYLEGNRVNVRCIMIFVCKS